MLVWNISDDSYDWQYGISLFFLFVFKCEKLHLENYVQIIWGYSEFGNARLTIDNMITLYFLRDSTSLDIEVLNILFSHSFLMYDEKLICWVFAIYTVNAVSSMFLF